MRSLKMLLGLLLLFGIAITAEAQKVSIDYDHQANFSDYKTFSWISPPHFRADPLMDQRIIDSVNAALTSKGWQFVPEGGDVGIAAHVATRENHTLETLYTGLAEAGDGILALASAQHSRQTTPYEVGTIVIDMFDSRTKQLVWRGTGHGSVVRKAREGLEEDREGDRQTV